MYKIEICQKEREVERTSAIIPLSQMIDTKAVEPFIGDITFPDISRRYMIYFNACPALILFSGLLRFVKGKIEGGGGWWEQAIYERGADCGGQGQEGGEKCEGGVELHIAGFC